MPRSPRAGSADGWRRARYSPTRMGRVLSVEPAWRRREFTLPGTGSIVGTGPGSRPRLSMDRDGPIDRPDACVALRCTHRERIGKLRATPVSRATRRPGRRAVHCGRHRCCGPRADRADRAARSTATRRLGRGAAHLASHRCCGPRADRADRAARSTATRRLGRGAAHLASHKQKRRRLRGAAVWRLA